MRSSCRTAAGAGRGCAGDGRRMIQWWRVANRQTAGRRPPVNRWAILGGLQQRAAAQQPAAANIDSSGLLRHAHGAVTALPAGHASMAAVQPAAKRAMPHMHAEHSAPPHADLCQRELGAAQANHVKPNLVSRGWGHCCRPSCWSDSSDDSVTHWDVLELTGRHKRQSPQSKHCGL